MVSMDLKQSYPSRKKVITLLIILSIVLVVWPISYYGLFMSVNTPPPPYILNLERGFDYFDDLKQEFNLSFDCMSSDFFQRYKGSSHMEDKSTCNLCQNFQGRLQHDMCSYQHPNVVHYVKLALSLTTKFQLTFQEFVSIVSVDKFFKPDKIVIHTNNRNITGSYWNRASRIATPIELRFTERVKSIGTSKQSPGYITHEADYIKVSTCYSEGGLYMDFDAVLLDGFKLRKMFQRSECFIGRDDNKCTRLCAGLFSCVANSTFMKKWLEGYETNYWPRSWLYNAGVYPSQVLCECPHCYDVTVYSYMSNWKEANYRKWQIPNSVSWENRAAVHYMNGAFMKPLKPPKELLAMDTPFTDLIKHVLGDLAEDFMK